MKIFPSSSEKGYFSYGKMWMGEEVKMNIKLVVFHMTELNP